MRKLPRFLLLSAILAMLLCVSAFAADQGIYGAKAKGDATVSFKYYTAGGAEVTAAKTMYDKQVYEDAVKIEVTYTGTVTANAQYLFVVQNDAQQAPTSQTIVYIDQDAAQAGTITFTAYPSELTSGKTYHVYLASSDTANGAITALTEIAEYSYYAAYTLGDVNDDGNINQNDALRCLQYQVDAAKYPLSDTQKLAANVTKVLSDDDMINQNDALRILQYQVGIITTWDQKI